MGNYSIPHLYRDVNYLIFAAVCVVGKEKLLRELHAVFGHKKTHVELTTWVEHLSIDSTVRLSTQSVE